MTPSAETIHAESNIPLPPLNKIFVGLPDHTRFLEVGKHFVEHFKNLCDLKPEDKVLDVGSGIGRMAIPLAAYLNGRGSYDGLEIVKYGVDWCADNISSKYNNFKFHHLDVRNIAYNPNGTFNANEIKFPFKDESFDFVFLCSVFTHMLPDDLRNYTQEISRVLQTGGRYLITYFILNDYSIESINRGKIREPDKYCFRPSRLDNCWIARPDNPEWGVAYHENYISSILNEFQLGKDKELFPGAWTGRGPSTSFQDIIIGKKLVN